MYAHASPQHRPFARRRPRSAWPGRLRNAGLVAGAVLAMSFALAQAAWGRASSASETVTVQSGDTLWSIASDRYPGSDVRERIWEIQQANHLDTADLSPGEVLKVPTR
jgi:nucleoid-associated protein YgaU